MIEIVNLNKTLEDHLYAAYCQSFFCQLRGLMFTAHVEKQAGMLLVQSADSRANAAIHMFFVFTDLAVIWINSNFQVVDTVLAKSWRPIYIPREPAQYTLEIHPSRLGEFTIGDQVKFIHE